MASSLEAAEVKIHRQITADIAAGTGLRGLLSRIARAAARLCDADMAAITLLTDKRDELEMVGVHGIRPSILGTRLPVALSFNGLVITAGRSVRSADVLREPPPMVRSIPSMTGARGVLAVPLRDGSAPFGTLGVANRVCWQFTAHDQAQLTQLAGSASIAIQNAQLRERLSRALSPALQDGARANPLAGRPEPARRSQSLHGGDGACAYHFSPREREILRLLSSGKTCGEAAATLNISSRTVQHYLERLKVRFHQPRLPALVGYFVKHDL